MNEYDLLGSLHWVVKIHSSKSSIKTIGILKIRRVAERDTGNGPGIFGACCGLRFDVFDLHIPSRKLTLRI